MTFMIVSRHSYSSIIKGKFTASYNIILYLRAAIWWSNFDAHFYSSVYSHFGLILEYESSSYRWHISQQ